MQVLSWGRMPSKNGGDFAQMVEQQMADSTANGLSTASTFIVLLSCSFQCFRRQVRSLTNTSTAAALDFR